MQSIRYDAPGASAVAGSSTNRLPDNTPPLRGSIARAAVAHYAPEADTEVEEVSFQDDPKQPLYGTQFFREATNPRFTRMGWEQPGHCLPGLLTREVNQWILPYANIAQFSEQRQWHSRWMVDCICKSWLLCCEEHGFYLMLLKCLASRVMLNPNALTEKIREKSLTMAHVCDVQLRKELQVGNTFTLKTHEQPYFLAVVQHVRSTVDLEHPFKEEWTVIKPPDWVGRANESQPEMFVGTSRVR